MFLGGFMQRLTRWPHASPIQADSYTTLWDVTRPEWPLANVRRRLDLAVWAGENDLPTGVAVEIQASRISAEEMKARERDHGRAGFLTMWVFTLRAVPG
jgi:hypothetical protein